MQLTLILFPIALAIYGAIIYLFVLLVKALRKYIKSKDVREEKKAVCRSLGEALKTHRMEKQMTQEFVAETLGVSRQAVSKWENGTSDPSTSNLCALAKLYGIPVEELLHETQEEKSEDCSKKETAEWLSLLIPSKTWQSHFFEGGITLRFVPCRPQGGCDTRGVRRVNSDAHVVGIYD